MTVPARGLEGNRGSVLMWVLGLTVVLHVSLVPVVMVSHVLHLGEKTGQIGTGGRQHRGRRDFEMIMR